MNSGDSLRKNGPIDQSGGEGVDVTSTKMLSPIARESPCHNSGENTLTKYTTGAAPSTGELGGRGHAGAM